MAEDRWAKYRDQLRSLGGGKPLLSRITRRIAIGWLRVDNRSDPDIVFKSDPGLFTPRRHHRADPKKHPRVNAKPVATLIDGTTADAGQAAMASVQMGGEHLFFARANQARCGTTP